MIPFSTFLLRNYYNAIGWNEDNSYSQLTRSSTALLDFDLPQSLVLQLANAPTPIFFTSYSLDALPQLNGSLSYVTASQPLHEIQPSRSIAFRNVVDRFRVFPPPHRPLAKDEVWLGGRRVEGKDYLLYSRLHLPTLNLSGLATTRLTPTLQLHCAFLSIPSPPSIRPTSPTHPHPSHARTPSESSTPTPPSTPSNLLISLQHDVGRYAAEYSYSLQDGMFGWRGLYNFGWRDRAELLEEAAREAGRVLDEGTRTERKRAIDEEEMMEGGLRGRFSAGAEVYFSAKQRSFGVSTGLRFTTLPPPTPTPGQPPVPWSPPTTLTLLYNPLMGFISTAYSAQVHPHIALSSRFGVNLYSYESDLCIGGEWWIGRRRGKKGDAQAAAAAVVAVKADAPLWLDTRRGDEATTVTRVGEEDDVIRRRARHNQQAAGEATGPFAQDRVDPRAARAAVVAASETGPLGQSSTDAGGIGDADERDGVLKARITGNWSIGLLYEARIRNCLVSIGVNSDLLSRQKPIRSVGLEVQYFS